MRGLFDRSRFARRASSDEDPLVRRQRTQRRESVLVLFLVAGVTLSLLVLGVFMLYTGDQKWVVDLIVLGALCVFMGVVSCLLGMMMVLKPLYHQGKELERKNLEAAAAAAAAHSPPADHSNTTLSPTTTADLPWTTAQPGPSTS